MGTALFEWLSSMGQEFAVFVVSMIPLIELRGAVPLGIGIGMPWHIVMPLAYLGNCLPIPFILFLGPKVLNWIGTLKPFRKPVKWYQDKLHSKKSQVTKYAKYGLFLFVAVPLPGTGAWSGALIAALLDMPKGKALLSIVLGVIAAGIIMLIGSHVVVSAVNAM